VVGRARESGLCMCECTHDKEGASAGVEGGEARRVRVFPLHPVDKDKQLPLVVSLTSQKGQLHI